jgi:hypothetical protein
MINQTFHFTDQLDDLFDWESLSDDGIELSSDQIEQALQLCQAIPNPTQRWQTYLHALAMLGLQEWLAGCAPDLAMITSDCSILQPHYASLIETVCNLHIEPFNLCLIATGCVPSSTVYISRAAIDLPKFIPHFYVFVHVLEDQMQVQPYGYLRRDELVKQQQSHTLNTISN